MEWVETTAKTIEDARDAALDQLGVGADEAEIEIVEEPKAGLFGRMRGEARLRARVKPTPARSKQDRRRRGRGGKRQESSGGSTSRSAGSTDGDRESSKPAKAAKASTPSSRASGNGADDGSTSTQQQEPDMSTDDRIDDVTPEQVGDAAVAFMDGLTRAFGAEARCDLSIDGAELDLSVSGTDLGLLVGSGGRTLNAIQDLARVAAQRRLGDHETRLRIDVAGYRERRQEALARFARDVAAQVRDSGSARSMEPMSSADRKVIHDVLNEEDGVTSRSEGEDPDRRIVVLPAD
jgi:spoIIIJ-associated protein